MFRLGTAGCETEKQRALTISQHKAQQNRGLARKATIADLTLQNNALEARLAALEGKGGKKAPKAKVAPKAAPKAKKKKKKKAKSGNGGK